MVEFEVLKKIRGITGWLWIIGVLLFIMMFFMLGDATKDEAPFALHIMVGLLIFSGASLIINHSIESKYAGMEDTILKTLVYSRLKLMNLLMKIGSNHLRIMNCRN